MLSCGSGARDIMNIQYKCDFFSTLNIGIFIFCYGVFFNLLVRKEIYSSSCISFINYSYKIKWINFDFTYKPFYSNFQFPAPIWKISSCAGVHSKLLSIQVNIFVALLPLTTNSLCRIWLEVVWCCYCYNDSWPRVTNKLVF